MKVKSALLLLVSTVLLTGCSSTIVESNNDIVESTFSEEINLEEVINDTTEVLEKHEIIEEIPEPIEPEVFSVNIKMVGDCLIHETLYNQARQDDGSYNFDYMFVNVKNDIETADIAIINQETIFVNDESKFSGYPMFGSPVDVGTAEVNAGFDIIAHATNHTIDKGLQGITDTITFWNDNYSYIDYLGIHSSAEESDIVYKEVNNISFGFVNYTYGLNGLESRRIGNEYVVDMLTDDDVEYSIREAKENSEIVIAILHVGAEYVYTPTDYAQEQVDKCIDAGADIIICAHPHVVEPYEIRVTESGNEGLVYYSLGNFISAQDKLPRVIGGMADITINKTIYNGEETVEITEYNMIPLITHQERGNYTTYKLEDYSDELCKKHRLYSNQNFDCEYLLNFFNDIVNKTETVE